MSNEEDPTAPETTLRTDAKGSGFIPGNAELGQKVRPVTYSIFGDQAIAEGCIVLGEVALMDQFREEVVGVGGPENASILASMGNFQKLARFLWPLGRIPFTVENLQDQDRVHKAMEHWTDKVGIEFVPRTSQVDFVTFRRGDISSSSCGRVGGRQFINLRDDATFGTVVHEIGHALGLWHEQGRSDRDAFVTINLANIDPRAAHNFDKHVDDGVAFGDYDYGSIMHYHAKAFSINGQPTIVPKGGAQIGQRNALSPGDIAVVKAAYKREFAKRV
jgi:hypothetical protein